LNFRGGAKVIDFLSVVDLDIFGSTFDIGNVDNIFSGDLKDHFVKGSEVEFLCTTRH